MIVERLRRRIQTIYRRLSSPSDAHVYYVTDNAGWSFDWDAYYITSHLSKYIGDRKHAIIEPWGLRNQIIHFGDRYKFFYGPHTNLEKQNYVFLTWFHGSPEDNDPALMKLFESLPDAVNGVEKIVVSCEISSGVLQEQGIEESKLIKIPLGVDLKRFTPAGPERRSQIRKSLGIPETAICIGSFQKDGAGWKEGLEPKWNKGPDIFLEVIAALSKSYPDLFVLLTGPARGFVVQGLKRIGVNYIHCLLDDYLEIVPYYQTLDLYIISSRAEGGPKALLESWATGVPVVSTRVGMAADLIENGENGLLCDINDTDRITDAASLAIEDLSFRDKCRRQALRDVRPYSWSDIAHQYYSELYRPILEDWVGSSTM